MNTEDSQPFNVEILTDKEFAKLMQAEFSAAASRKTGIARNVLKFQMALWAAGLGVFVLHPVERLTDLETEFGLLPYTEQPTDDQSVLRTKNDVSTLKPKPTLLAEFSRVKKRMAESDDRMQTKSMDIVQLTLSTAGIRSVRADVHVNGKLLTARGFDTLSDPLEVMQDALVNEKKWGYALDSQSTTLICIKPAMAPASPSRLSRDEMKQRADTFHGRCYFHEPEAK